VSLRALAVDPAAADSAPPGPATARSRLRFTPEPHAGAEGEAPGLRVRWVEEPAGEVAGDHQLIGGSFLLSTDESAVPTLVFEDENSYRYLTVTG